MARPVCAAATDRQAIPVPTSNCTCAIDHRARPMKEQNGFRRQERTDVLVRALLHHSKDSPPRLHVRLAQPNLPHHRQVARCKSMPLPRKVAKLENEMNELLDGLHNWVSIRHD